MFTLFDDIEVTKIFSCHSLEITEDEIEQKIAMTQNINDSERAMLKSLLIEYKDVFLRKTGRLNNFEYEFNFIRGRSQNT